MRPLLLIPVLALSCLVSGTNTQAQSYAQYLSLQKQVTALQAQVAALNNKIAFIQTNHALLLGSFVTVDPSPEAGVIGPNITFTGVNIHIVSGSGSTDGPRNGLGNLIIGYDESPAFYQGYTPGLELQPGDRSGSHNLVIGKGHRFNRNAFGGLLAGEWNSIGAEGASVLGGRFNSSSGLNTVTLGGFGSVTLGDWSTICGGASNAAYATGISILGGTGNTEYGVYGVVLGGRNSSGTASFEILPY